jgi:glycosyltransferase involved in cell wall biosynthesis
MSDLCFITTCMGRLKALQQTLGSMVGQSDGAGVVVVDYSCPDRAGDWVEAHHPLVRVVRAPGRGQFNLAAARNIGARHADAPCLCFVDADVVLDPGFAAAIRPALAPGGFYRARSDDPGLGGTFVCARADFERVGGYDEVYPCWGEEDNDFFDALQFVGLEQRSFPAALVRHLPHDDAVRTRFYPVADKALGHAINRVYRILKWDTARLRRELLSVEMRRGLYEKVAEVVTASFRSGRPGELTIHLPVGLVPGDWTLSRSLSYRLMNGR